MSQIMSVILMMMNSLMFSSMLHPMSMGITLLTQTILMCFLTGIMSYSSWFSYILFLVFLGGMLVLFIYMTSIASNELFNKSMYFTLMIMMISIIIMLMLLMTDPFMSVVPNTEMYSSTYYINKFTMTSLYNNPSSSITVFMVLYLFLTLIVIVSMTKSNSGPLRPTN